LRRFPYGESSLVAHFMTREHGRVALLAKGAFRPTSGHAGVIDLFDTLELSWKKPLHAELGVLTGARLVQRRRAIPADLERYREALAVLELCEQGALAEAPDPGLYDLLEGSLGSLAGGLVEPAVARIAFDLGFLQNLGLAPALADCASCGGPAPATRRDGEARATFSASSGGRLCARCAREARSAGRRVGTLPSALLAMAASLLTSPPELLPRLRMGGPQRARLSELVHRFLEYHLERLPRSRRAGLARAHTS